MGLEEILNDYNTFKNCIKQCDNSLDNFKRFALHFHQMRNAIMDDPDRLAQFQTLLDLDDEITLQDLVDKYNDYYAIYQAILAAEQT